MEVSKLLNQSSDQKNEDNLLAMVNTVENMKDDQNAKKQCPIMWFYIHIHIIIYWWINCFKKYQICLNVGEWMPCFWPFYYT